MRKIVSLAMAACILFALPVISFGAGSVDLKLQVTDSWEDNGETVNQYSGVVTNNSGSAVDSWSVTSELDAASITDHWNCEISIDEGRLVMSNVDYNGRLEVGQSTEIGFIASSVAGGSAGEAEENEPHSLETAADTESTGGTQTELRKGVQGDDWLFAQGNKIVDSDGNEVWITGVNWFGYNTGTNTFDGLWAANMESTVTAVADRGFNLIRAPISVELIKSWSEGTYPEANYNKALNPNLEGKNSLEIFDYFMALCEDRGIKVMLDIHSALTDAMGHMANMWYGGGVSTDDFNNALVWIAQRYADNDTLIAIDLKNEPHGKADETPRAKWDDSQDEDNWKYAAETAAGKILGVHPNVLIVIEGIEIYPVDNAANAHFTSQNDDDYHFGWWGANLRGVADNPVDLGKYQNKIVYSPHDYGPAVYQQPWFYDGYTYESIYEEYWQPTWMYIYEDNIAPLHIGEWGGFMEEPNLTWLTHIRKLIVDNKIHHTYWCLNANSGDTGGLLMYDFTTFDEERYAFVAEALWQKDGKFVGLDAAVPLGNNGTTRF